MQGRGFSRTGLGSTELHSQKISICSMMTNYKWRLWSSRHNMGDRHEINPTKEEKLAFFLSVSNALLSVLILVLNIYFIIAMALFYNEWGNLGRSVKQAFLLSLITTPRSLCKWLCGMSQCACLKMHRIKEERNASISAKLNRVC